MACLKNPTPRNPENRKPTRFRLNETSLARAPCSSLLSTNQRTPFFMRPLESKIVFGYSADMRCAHRTHYTRRTTRHENAGKKKGPGRSSFVVGPKRYPTHEHTYRENGVQKKQKAYERFARRGRDSKRAEGDFETNSDERHDEDFF